MTYVLQSSLAAVNKMVEELTQHTPGDDSSGILDPKVTILEAPYFFNDRLSGFKPI